MEPPINNALKEEIERLNNDVSKLASQMSSVQDTLRNLPSQDAKVEEE